MSLAGKQKLPAHRKLALEKLRLKAFLHINIMIQGIFFVKHEALLPHSNVKIQGEKSLIFCNEPRLLILNVRNQPCWEAMSDDHEVPLPYSSCVKDGSGGDVKSIHSIAGRSLHYYFRHVRSNSCNDIKVKLSYLCVVPEQAPKEVCTKACEGQWVMSRNSASNHSQPCCVCG